MRRVTLELNNNIADKFDKYIKFFGSNELMFDKFIDYHINRLKREISRMQEALDKYEIKYNMTTEHFYKLFDNGEMDDDKDYMIWAGIYELQLDSKKKLDELK